jgi:arsenate reductase (thioredoxin)
MYNVLFLSTRNAARTLMAECILDQRGGRKFKGFSAGSEPAEEVHPFALHLLDNCGYNVSRLRPKSWQEFAGAGAKRMHFIIALCPHLDATPMPFWPGRPVLADWSVPDPTSMKGNIAEQRLAFADAHRMLYQRIDSFINLPAASLDELSMSLQLAAINRAIKGRA